MYIFAYFLHSYIIQCVEHSVVFTTSLADKANIGSCDVQKHQINARDFFIPSKVIILPISITVEYSSEVLVNTNYVFIWGIC